MKYKGSKKEKHKRNFLDVCHSRCVNTHSVYIPQLIPVYILSKCFLKVILLTCKDQISPINFIIEYMVIAT